MPILDVQHKSGLRTTVCAVAVSLMVGTALQAQDVTLIVGDTEITGEFVEFSDNTYILRTALGDLRVAGDSTRCIGDACPTFETDDADFRIQGSGTIGSRLMPLLLEGYSGGLNAAATVSPTAANGDVLVKFTEDDGFGEDFLSLVVNSTDTLEGFDALSKADADIVMASRRIRPDEARTLREAGVERITSPEHEHVLAVDSLVVLLHPDNPFDSLTIQQVADIFANRVDNWSEFGGPDEKITVVHRRPGSGAREVFMERLFGDAEPYQPWSLQAADGNQMAALVNDGPWTIGYGGYAFQRGAKAISLLNECGIEERPSPFAARTEEYSLQRRLYLYTREAASSDQDLAGLLTYATSQAADAVIGKAGFIGLGMDRRNLDPDSDRIAELMRSSSDNYEAGFARELIAQMKEHDRLSTTFRFRTGSSQLDERGVDDLSRLADYLKDQGPDTEVMFVGFTDDVGPFDSNLLLAKDRAESVMDRFLSDHGAELSELSATSVGYGEIAPATCNVSDEGRRINRRVEVWVSSQGETE